MPPTSLGFHYKLHCLVSLVCFGGFGSEMDFSDEDSELENLFGGKILLYSDAIFLIRL